jgi:hypothetical protein
MPVDDVGNPLESVPMSVEDARRLGGFDPESVRATQEHRNHVLAKDRGEAVIWNSDPRIAISEMFRVHSNALVEIKQVHPKEDDNIPSRPLSFIRDYDGLRRYITEAHWNKKDATYQWWVRAQGFPQIGTGKITFAEVEDMSRQGNGNGGYPPQQYQQYQQPQYAQPPQQQYAQPPQQQQYAPAPQYAAPAPQQPQYAAPAPQPQQTTPGPQGSVPLVDQNGVQVGWMINGIAYVPQPQQPQQQQPVQQQMPQQPPQPIVVQAPPPAPGGGLDPNFLVTQLLQMARDNADQLQQQLLAVQRQQAQPQQQHPGFVPMYQGLTPLGYGVPPGLTPVMQQPVQQAAPTPAPAPVEPPPPPPSALEMMQRGFKETTEVMQLQKKFVDTVKQVAGIDDSLPEAPPAPIAVPEDFPLKTKEIDGVTVGSIDGEMMGFGETALLNAPKLLGVVTGFADKLWDRYEKAQGSKKNEEAEAIARQREAVELEERQTKARIDAQREKVQFEAAKLQIRAAHTQLDAQQQQVVETPYEPPPPPEPPPAPPVQVAPEPEKTPVPVPPNGAMD